MTNAEIRRKILEMLYERFKEHPYNRVDAKEFRECLGINLKELHFNIIYLEEKGYVELQKPLEGSLFVGARITSKGIDLAEDEYQLSILFPLQPGPQIISEKVFEQLNSLISETNEMHGLSADSKELITEELKEIQNELRKTEPSYVIIKNYVDRLKERSYDICYKLMTIIRDPAVANALSRAAKKELGI